MPTLRRLLVPVDGSGAADAAVRWASALARASGAEVHLLHVLPDADPPPEGGAPRALQLLGAHGRHLRGLPVCHAVEHGAPAAAILAYAEEQDVELIVMGTHGRRGVRRLLLGSVAEAVLHGARVPTLVAPEGTGARPLFHVLAPTDFSAAARLALPVAVDVAETAGAALTLLHVLEPPPALAGLAGATTAQALLPDLHREAEAALALLEAPRRAARVVGEGAPAEAIAAFAEAHGVDLVVQARHERGRLGRLLLGSVTEQTARRVRCALLVLPVDERPAR